MGYFIGVSFGTIMVALVLFIIDGCASRPNATYGQIVDRQYKPEHTSIGVGYGASSNGKPAAVVTTSTDPEQFLIMVKLPSQKIVTVECDPELYYQKKEGDNLRFNTYKGLFTGWVYSRSAKI